MYRVIDNSTGETRDVVTELYDAKQIAQSHANKTRRKHTVWQPLSEHVYTKPAFKDGDYVRAIRDTRCEVTKHPVAKGQIVRVVGYGNHNVFNSSPIVGIELPCLATADFELVAD